jgi:arsenate reductase (thioredoxin)
LLRSARPRCSGGRSFYSLDGEAAGDLLGNVAAHLSFGSSGWREDGRCRVADRRPRVLFLCTHNSARSQMAEGLLRHLAGHRFEVHSAGTEATSVRPEAIAAMAKIGADVSGQESKTLERYLGESFEYVITVCDAANEACPIFPGAKNRLHWSFEDPPQATGTEEERLKLLRRVRDEIRERIEEELLLEEEQRSELEAP